MIQAIFFRVLPQLTFMKETRDSVPAHSHVRTRVGESVPTSTAYALAGKVRTQDKDPICCKNELGYDYMYFQAIEMSLQ